MNKKIKSEIREFLVQSNYIESEARELAHEDAMEAFEYAYEFDKPWNVNFILKVHKLLMQRVRPDIAGKLRDCDVWIGGKRKIFVSESLLKEDLKNWLLSVNMGEKFDLCDAEEYCQNHHIRFEQIHCFEDGNGRTGRILWQVQRLKYGLPVQIIKEDEKLDYYKWFK